MSCEEKKKKKLKIQVLQWHLTEKQKKLYKGKTLSKDEVPAQVSSGNSNKRCNL